ncbi:MAG TPA: hypothetical protein VEC99_02270 [Clostridia bacterium]|nr:hypothetical protein [Clostridia bacterium]
MKGHRSKVAHQVQRGLRLFSAELKHRSEKFYSINADQSAITCHVCGFTSQDPKDVQEKFCPQCRSFHEDRILMLRLSEGFQKEFRSESEEWTHFRIAA